MDLEKYMLPCLVKKYAGIDCPGCGMQRSVALLLKGEFSDAFHMFPAIYTTIFFFILIALNFLDKSRNYHRFIRATAIVNAVMILGAFTYKYLTY